MMDGLKSVTSGGENYVQKKVFGFACWPYW